MKYSLGKPKLLIQADDFYDFISARPPRRQWRTKSSVCSVRKSAKCDFFLNLMKKSLTFRLWKDGQVHSGILRCKTGTIWYQGTQRPDGLWWAGAWYSGRWEDGTVPDHVRYRRDFQFFDFHDLYADVQSSVWESGWCDIVNIGWHIYLKDIISYAARPRDW